jgi:hypothetical protein
MRGIVLLPALLAPGLAAAQPTNHIGEPLANIMLRNGCEMQESAASEALRSEGYDISDFQAQVMALNRGGYLVSGDAQGALRLVKWGACS